MFFNVNPSGEEPHAVPSEPWQRWAAPIVPMDGLAQPALEGKEYILCHNQI